MSLSTVPLADARRLPARFRGVRADLWALAATGAAALLTIGTWPVFDAAPFAPMFLAVYISVRWGTRRSGLLATGVGVLAMSWLLPFSGPLAWLPIAVFTAIGVLATRLITGRTEALELLQESEARAVEALANAEASEAKLRQAQKMEAVGQLVAGVAHNFNNLLTITMGYTELALAHRKTAEEVRSLLREVQHATERGARMTQQLLALTRTRDARVSIVDVNATLRDLQGLLRPLIREDIELSLATPEMPSLVLIDPQDLEQVLLNLVLNARDALPDGGSIALEVSRARVPSSDIPAAFTALPGDFVRFTVRDTGTGMSADVQTHLFEPFFTTKDVDKGTGLGLAFTFGVVRNAHGFVTVESAPGEGTAVMIWLPEQKAEVTGQKAETF